MPYYHGSPVAGLTELKPFLSEHGKPYIYFATNPVVALLYAVKPVSKPLSFYPYGFDGEKVVYSEYYEGAFADIYKGKSGCLYECDALPDAQTPTAINGVYTCEQPVKPDRSTAIADLFAKYREYERQGLFYIRPFEVIPPKELAYIYGELKKDVEKFRLHDVPDSAASLFIKIHFPNVWEI
ncbi:MAG: hypothetical protein J1E39_04385 [Eubacterium sp.]|nr:hypothetical protein [Eubacterium sp.]